jgi:hypothetical protein
LFEVSSKYVPPIRPIGRGAYGIVWWVFCFFLSLMNYFSWLSFELGLATCLNLMFVCWKWCYVHLNNVSF